MNVVSTLFIYYVFADARFRVQLFGLPLPGLEAESIGLVDFFAPLLSTDPSDSLLHLLRESVRKLTPLLPYLQVRSMIYASIVFFACLYLYVPTTFELHDLQVDIETRPTQETLQLLNNLTGKIAVYEAPWL